MKASEDAFVARTQTCEAETFAGCARLTRLGGPGRIRAFERMTAFGTARAACRAAALSLLVVAHLAAAPQQTGPEATASRPDATLSAAAPQQAAAAPVAPASPAPTPLAALIGEAQRNNPQILASRRAWQAAEQVPSQVSTPPDPQVIVQDVSAGTPIPFWDYDTVQMTFFGVGVSQALPYPGKLRLRGEQARRRAGSLGDRLETVRRSIAEQLSVVYDRLSYVQETLEILARDEALIDQVEKIADARYRVGQGNQQDILKAQLESTKLERDVTESHQQLGSLEAQLKQLLNRPPDSADIAAETLTETPLPYTSDELLARVLTGNPEVSTEQQIVRSKSLGVELAKKDFYPDFNVQYMWQRTGAPFPDRYSVSVGIKIPLYRSRRRDPELAQAAAELSESRRDYEAQVQQAYFDVKDQYLAADSSAKVLKIYREGLIPQATATFHAGLAAYQVGHEDFQTLLDSFRDVLNLDTEYWRTLADHESALARLKQLTGVPSP
jgi:outer membrane protein, heavy metal efflux system